MASRTLPRTLPRTGARIHVFVAKPHSRVLAVSTDRGKTGECSCAPKMCILGPRQVRPMSILTDLLFKSANAVARANIL